MAQEDTVQRKLAAIMFTDMVGYSVLTQKNETLALKLLDEHRQLLRPVFVQHSGREIQTIGDAFLVEFHSTSDAVRCAVAMQRNLREHNASSPETVKIQIRIGIHVGDVVHRDNDVLGDGVNIAARVEPLAEPGGICVTEDVARQIQSMAEFSLIRLGKGELKNIQTPVRLYKVVLPWEVKRLAGSETVRFQLKRKRVRGALALIALGLAAASVYFAPVGSLRRDLVPPAEINSIAVLPFDLQSQSQADQFLSESLPDELIRALSRIRGLKVAARDSSFAFKDGKPAPRNIGGQLKVRTLLQGDIRKSGDRLDIGVTLINVTDGSPLWSKTYDGQMTDLPVIGRDIARAVATTLQVPLTDEQRQRMASPPTEHPEAYRSYLEGSYFLYRWSEAYIDPAIELLEKAVALDSKSASVHARLAQAYVQKAFSVDSQPRWQAKAAAEIEAALALDPDCAEAFLARGKILWSPWNRFDHALAVGYFRRAVAVDPNLAEAYHHLAMVYIHVGLFGKAREASRRAQDLDPLNSGALFREGGANLYEGRFPEALAVYERMPPSFQPALVAMQTATTLLYLRRPNEAKARLEKVLTERSADPLLRSTLAVLYAGRGETNQAVEEIRLAAAQEKEYLGHYHHVAYNIASAHALMNEKAPALDWLRKAADDGYPCYPRFEKDPHLENLRADPEFRSFMGGLRRRFEHYQKTL